MIKVQFPLANQKKGMQSQRNLKINLFVKGAVPDQIAREPRGKHLSSSSLL